VLANSRGNNVRLVERAPSRRRRSARTCGRAMMLGAIVAFLVAVGLVLGLDYLDDTGQDARRHRATRTALPALIPAVRSGRDRPSLSGHNDFAEAIRSLRTSIALSTRQGGSIVLVTSAQPLEGKTTTACNLATALAYGGAKVLLIDADMRPAWGASQFRPREPLRAVGAFERTGASHSGGSAPRRARLVDHVRRVNAAQSV
jgi:hypothetical protein